MKTPKIQLALLFTASLALLPAVRAHDSTAEFKMMDKDGDGRISREEHAAGAQAMFVKMDQNHDGIVTSTEMDAYVASMKAAHPGAADKAGPMMTSAEKIRMVDMDGDGQLSAAEHAAGSVKMFDLMDTNHDGFLSAEELAAGHKKMMEKSN